MRTILVVDDDRDMVDGIKLGLEMENYKVLTAYDGEEALKLMERTPPDLILADVIMPRMDGYTLFERIRQHPYWKAIPFIFITSKGEEKDIRAGRELGSDDYITKPFEIEDLLAAIRSRLKRKVEIQEVCAREAEDLKEHLSYAQRMAALGLLSASFAHEIGNILTGVIGYAEILRRQMERGEPSLEDLDRLITQTERAVNLARSALNFSRRRKSGRKMAFVPEAVEHVLALMEHRLRRNRVKVKKEFKHRLPPVQFDPNELEQVLLNLILNAIQAMPDGGELEIKAQRVEEHLLMEVRDTGVGISSEDLRRIYEPFFTTKEDNGGTGLGLYICRYIIEKYGGEIDVESEAGKGTVFYLKLPAVKRGEGSSPPALRPSSKSTH